MAKAKTPLEEAASALLKRTGKDENAWKKEVLEKAQFNFLRGNDRELEEFVINRERNKIVLDEIKKISN